MKVKHSDLCVTRTGNYFVDASDLRLPPGEFPVQVETEKCVFKQVAQVDFQEGELRSVAYENDSNEILTIYND